MKYLKKFEGNINDEHKVEKKWIGEELSKYWLKNKKGLINDEIGQNVVDYFAEHDLYIKINKEHGPQNELPGESLYTEYRVFITKKLEFEKWLKYIEGKTIDEFIKDFGEESFEEYKKDWEKEEGTIDLGYLREFSVFLPDNTNATIQEAMYDASQYLVLLNDTIPHIIDGAAENRIWAFEDQTEGFIKFLKKRAIIIHNGNLPMVLTVSHRLRHDSKWFTSFREVFGDKYSNDFFKGWLNLLGETPDF